jgi:hypothetical protein
MAPGRQAPQNTLDSPHVLVVGADFPCRGRLLSDADTLDIMAWGSYGAGLPTCTGAMAAHTASLVTRPRGASRPVLCDAALCTSSL